MDAMQPCPFSHTDGKRFIYKGKECMHMNKERQLPPLMALLLVLTVLLTFGSLTADAAAAMLPKPAQRAYVVDTANMVSAEDAAQISAIGAELRDRTTAEIVVVTIPTLDGADIDTYANELFRSWGIGNAQMDNGVLLLIAKEDRTFRIEVGYGLEGEITDGRAGELLDAMGERFRTQDYSGAILEAYQKLAVHAYHAAETEPPASLDEPLGLFAYVFLGVFGLCVCIVFFYYGLVLLSFLWTMLRDLLCFLSSGAIDLPVWDISSSHGSSDGSSSSGSDYGGGSSGGGGASGRW